MNNLYEYLNNNLKINRLSPSWIISTSDINKVFKELKDFIALELMGSSIFLDQNPDFYLVKRLESAKDISIDQIRELQKFLNKTAGIGSKRVAIIYEADLMNLYASNACLQILEESKKFSYIFLLTKKPSCLIQTIRSRCSYFNVTKFNNISEEEEYKNFVDSLNKNNLERNLAVIKELKNKDRELWLKLNDFSFELISRIIKKIVGIKVNLIESENKILNQFSKNSSRNSLELYQEEIFKENNKNNNFIINNFKLIDFVIKKFDNIFNLAKNTSMYDLDLTASYILLLEEFKK